MLTSKNNKNKDTIRYLKCKLAHYLMELENNRSVWQKIKDGFNAVRQKMPLKYVIIFVLFITLFVAAFVYYLASGSNGLQDMLNKLWNDLPSCFTVSNVEKIIDHSATSIDPSQNAFGQLSGTCTTNEPKLTKEELSNQMEGMTFAEMIASWFSSTPTKVPVTPFPANGHNGNKGKENGHKANGNGNKGNGNQQPLNPNGAPEDLKKYYKQFAETILSKTKEAQNKKKQNTSQNKPPEQENIVYVGEAIFNPEQKEFWTQFATDVLFRKIHSPKTEEQKQSMQHETFNKNDLACFFDGICK